MRTLAASIFALLALGDIALAQHYVEPSDVSRATVARHSFGSKKHAKGHHARLDHEKQRHLDAAHKAALKKIPDQPQPTDPWAKVR
jgi:hypothetical protein